LNIKSSLNSLADGLGNQIAWRFGITGALSTIQSMTMTDTEEYFTESHFREISLFEF